MSIKIIILQKHYIKAGCHSSSRIITDDQYVCVCVREGGGVEGDSQN